MLIIISTIYHVLICMDLNASTIKIKTNFISQRIYRRWTAMKQNRTKPWAQVRKMDHSNNLGMQINKNNLVIDTQYKQEKK